LLKYSTWDTVAAKMSGTAAVRRTTLKDIAQIAGVSVSTASLVLAGKAATRRISPEVEQRVREIARQRDYTPNLLVRSMQRGRTNVLSFYSSFRLREPNDLYMDRLSTAIERAAGEYGYDVLVHCDFRRSAEAFYRHVNGGLSDGLIFFGPAVEDQLLPLLRDSRLPTVLFNLMDEAGKLSSVTEDMADGMRQVAQLLLTLGHRRIGAITSAPHQRSDAVPRIALLRQYLAEQGVDLPEEHTVPIAESGNYPAGPALQALLNGPNPPTALFCWHDRVGYRVLEACDRVGIAVPERLSLIGYDGLHWPSVSPHVLASVVSDLDKIADTTVRLLDQLIRGEATTPVTRQFPVRVDRGTTLASPSIS
jgi:DNA-binding LacI/PurR family transcriptional regulator